MNCLAIEQNDGILVVDCGTSFPHDDLGVDVLHPDFTWLLENVERLRGIVITHGHEDHIGALPFLLDEVDVPVWGPAACSGFGAAATRGARILRRRAALARGTGPDSFRGGALRGGAYPRVALDRGGDGAGHPHQRRSAAAYRGFPHGPRPAGWGAHGRGAAGAAGGRGRGLVAQRQHEHRCARPTSKHRARGGRHPGSPDRRSTGASFRGDVRQQRPAPAIAR